MHRYVHENQILVNAACDAIVNGRADLLGAAMQQFQEMFDATASIVMIYTNISFPYIDSLIYHLY